MTKCRHEYDEAERANRTFGQSTYALQTLP